MTYQRIFTLLLEPLGDLDQILEALASGTETTSAMNLLIAHEPLSEALKKILRK